VSVVRAPGDAADRDVVAVEQVTADRATAGRTTPDQGDCVNCGHRLDQHDRVALRYCEASVDHAKRGCICPGMITTAAEATAQA
jgi:hypothetical protein